MIGDSGEQHAARGTQHAGALGSCRVLRAACCRGFSIAEMLVVVAVFAIGSLALISTYVNFTRLHRRVANGETLGEDMRFTLELLVRAARNNTVSYPSGVTSLTRPVAPPFILKSVSGSSTIYIQKSLSTDTECSGLSADCLALSLDNGATWTAITGKYVNIDRFNAYVTPLINPFFDTGVGMYNNNSQPRVTFVIDASYKVPGAMDPVTLSVQTSVSSRIYVR